MNKHLRLAIVVMTLSTLMAGVALGEENAEAARFQKEAKKQGLMYFEGRISAIDFKANTVTIKKKEGAMTFTCNDSTKYFIVGQKAEGKLSNFKVEEWARVFYSVKDGTPVATRLWQRGAFADKKERIEEKQAPKTN
ncbi:MAG TPA: hypothetical protein VL486_03010 [Verrucomicrobiae bacterium]|nr:hypothetical protein [Verrucomicrobiae bacterium]